MRSNNIVIASLRTKTDKRSNLNHQPPTTNHQPRTAFKIMNKNKITKICYILCAWICGIAFSLLCVFLAVYMVAFNRTIYHNSMVRAEAEFFNSHDLSQEQLDYVIDDVLKYLVDGRKEMDTAIEGYEGELFREIEVRHMVDVKALFTAIKWVTVACALTAPLTFAAMIFLDRERYRLKHRNLFKYTLIGNGLFIGLLVLLMLIDFNWAFEQFHYLFFNNMDWQLSSSDLLIEMLPENLFMRLALSISAAYVGLMSAFFFTGFFQRQIGKKLFKRKSTNQTFLNE